MCTSKLPGDAARTGEHAPSVPSAPATTSPPPQPPPSAATPLTDQAEAPGSDAGSEHSATLAFVRAALAGACAELAPLRRALTDLAAHTARLGEVQAAQAQRDAAVVRVAERNRQLEESFFEQELLPGVVRPLISLADSARDKRARLVRHAERHVALPATDVCATCTSVLEYFDLHVLDIHTSLATLGVECYTNPEPRFAPTLQRCFTVVPVQDPAQHGMIASRVAPGYRRNGHIIRPEQVRVCVVTHDAMPAHTGG